MRFSLLPLVALAVLMPLSPLAPTDACAEEPPPFAFFWGGKGNLSGSFNSPLAITVDPDGDVYTVDYQDRRTQQFTRDGHFIQSWGEQANEIASAPNGNILYITDWGRGLEVFSPDGQRVGGTLFDLEIGTHTWAHGYGVDAGPDDRIYVSLSESGISKIGVYSSLALKQRMFDAPSLGKIAVDGFGNLYLAGVDRRVYRIRVDDGTAELWGNIGSVLDIAVDASGNVYIVKSDRAYKYDSSGTLLSSWGSLGGDQAFDDAVGITVNDRGDVYVIERNGSRVQMFGERLPDDDPPPPPPPPQEPGPFNVGIMIHVIKANPPANICTAYSPPSRDGVVTLGDASGDGTARYYGVLLAAPMTEDPTQSFELAGMQLAIDYPPTGTPGGGVNIVSWTSCGDLEFPQDDWTEPGGGNTITWVTPENCQVEDFAVAGVFYISAYTPGTLSVVPYDKTGKIKVANCRAAEMEIEVPMTQAGWVSFGGAGKGTDTDGCNPLLTPCNDEATPVRPTTWGRIKTQYRGEN